MSRTETTQFPVVLPNGALLHDVRLIIDASRVQLAQSVNAELSGLYWQVGRRIRTDILRGERADYGEQVISKLADALTQAYGRGWSKQQLRHCLRFAEVFQDDGIVSAVRRQFPWTHIKTLMYIDDALKRDFYLEIARLEKWSSRQLQERIQSMLYERTAISRKPEATIRQELDTLRQEEKLLPDMAFRDPYLLDFLGLADTFAEKDLEAAILANLQRFIAEIGTDFAFLARQKRITIDNRDYYMDLLFYHRRLRCLVVIELKLGEFEAAYKGQMELYLRYLEKHDVCEGENLPIGLILCAGKNTEHIELLQLDASNIRVAEYMTILPPRDVLQKQLHRAIAAARHRLGQNVPADTEQGQ